MLLLVAVVVTTVLVTLLVAVMASPLLIVSQWLGRSLQFFDDRVAVRPLLGSPRTHAFDQLGAIKCVVGRNGSCRIAMRFDTPSSRRTHKVELSDSRQAFWRVATLVTTQAEQRGIPIQYGLIDTQGQHFWSLRPTSD